MGNITSAKDHYRTRNEILQKRSVSKKSSQQAIRGYVGARQTTIASSVTLSGIGVHSGAPVTITLHPAEANSAIRFMINDGNEIKASIPAHYDAVTNVTLCTILGDDNGATVATVEHLMAALWGLSIDNVIVEIDNGEVPIMDGSAIAFVRAIEEVGIVELKAPRRFIKVLKPVRVDEDGCWGELLPYNGLRLDIEIDFETKLIGRQSFSADLNPGVFREEISKARTFGFMKDVERLWAAGRALGASLENTVALGEDKIINPEGLRYSNEFVRHKALDAIGDLALAGAPLLCHYRSYRGGHALNAKVLAKLFADDEAWAHIEAPITREPAHVDMHAGAGLAVANYAADRS